MDGDNDADGKECIKHGWTDKDFKQPENYVPGPDKEGNTSFGKSSSGKMDKEKDDGY